MPCHDLVAGMPQRLNISIFHGPGESDLAAALAPPATIVVDAQCPDGAVGLPDAALLLRLSTVMATRLDAADAFASALQARFPQLAEMTCDIRFAVHEAVANAVVHGNLGLDSAMRSTLEDLRLFAAAMEARLGDPAHADLPVTIIARPYPGGVAISVEDSGAGFVPRSVLPPASAAAGGLGLAIIGKCCRRMRFSRGGRRITMLFGKR